MLRTVYRVQQGNLHPTRARLFPNGTQAVPRIYVPSHYFARKIAFRQMQ